MLIYIENLVDKALEFKEKMNMKDIDVFILNL
jgi:hypothetical protein